MGGSKRLGFKDNLTEFGKPEPPKFRVGTMVIVHLRGPGLFPEHDSEEGYEAKLFSNSASKADQMQYGQHRPLTADRFFDMLMAGATNQPDDEIYSTRHMGAHVHLMHLMPGTTVSDTKDSDDIVVRFDPIKAKDLADPSTP